MNMASNIETLFDLFENRQHQTSSVTFYDFNSTYVFNHKEFIESINEVSTTLFSVAGNETVVACIIKPSLLLPSIVFGILKSSSVFAFLDVHNPLVALKNLQKHVPVKVLIVGNKMLEGLDGLCSCWEETATKVIKGFSFSVLQSKNCKRESCYYPEARDIAFGSDIPIAYIVQTSGSTGEPKIVQVPHQCILPNILDLKSKFSISTDDNILLCSPLTFDPSIIDIFLFCASGCRLTIIPDEMKIIPQKLGEAIVKNKISIIQGTPSLITSLGDEFIQKYMLHKESHLKVLAFGGEICPSINRLRKWVSDGNKTMLFNLYGLTEVSCWSTCYKIDLADKFMYAAVPLGDPLSETIVKVEDNGEVQIGSSTRWCIIDNESFPKENTVIFRDTGDIVVKDSNGSVYFKKRKDNIMKHNGKMLSLEKLCDVLDVEQDLSNYSAYFHQSTSKLLLYLVLKRRKTFLESERNELIRKLRKLCPNVPSVELFTVPYIPLTHHGKTDYRKLLLLSRSELENKNEIISKENCSKIVYELWKEFTKDPNFTENCNFVISGGDSISALQLSSNIQWKFQITAPDLLDAILNSSFNDVVKLVQSYKLEKTVIEKQNNFEVLEQYFSLLPLKKKTNDNQCYQVFFRQGSLTRCTCGLNHSNAESNFANNFPPSSLALNLMFKFDLKKCIDASPCVVHYLKSDEMYCYIGSHAGIFCCLNITKAAMEWETVLPNRIESSACLSYCGNFVFVGCYDSYLYCFDSKRGNILWKFKTGAEIKCSPIVSSQNIVFVGSHNRYAYAINVNGELLWKRKISSGSIFGSPALKEEINAVCFATLDGTICLLKMDSGDLIWSFEYGKPLFSSPRITSSSIYVGSTDNNMLSFDLTGNLKWKYMTNGPVFSTVANYPGIGIIFGCHDDNVYCINDMSETLWNFSCDSPIYATPFVFTLKDQNLVAVASTKGCLYILKLKNGNLVSSYNCPGEIFSSPVVVNNLLLTGCRDNNVYCFKIE